MKELLEKLMEGIDLTESEAGELLDRLTDPDLDPPLAAAALAALRTKGESVDEVRGFAMGLRDKAIRPDIPDDIGAVDVVGTGGDGSGSLNLSTGAGLLAAACGQPVVKHGNRAISSRSGSADVLEALGMDIPLDEAESGRYLEETGFTYLFAPHYHPAMKAVGPVRRSLGVRTIFNMVGPLANPATPPFHVIGAFSYQGAAILAGALSGMPITRAFVIHGDPGWDEPTPIGPYHLFEVVPGQVVESVEDPEDVGLRRCRPEDLAGGSAEDNADRIRRVFQGEEGPHRDALVLGASLALRVTGSSDGAMEAIEAASAAIDDGRALSVIEAFPRLSGSDRKAPIG